jgi:hypothetical protein
MCPDMYSVGAPAPVVVVVAAAYIESVDRCLHRRLHGHSRQKIVEPLPLRPPLLLLLLLRLDTSNIDHHHRQVTALGLAGSPSESKCPRRIHGHHWHTGRRVLMT